MKNFHRTFKLLFLFLALSLSGKTISAQFQLESITVKDVSCKGGDDGEITITVSGGVPPYKYTWVRFDPIEFDQANVPEQTFTFPNFYSITPDNYFIEVTDAEGTTVSGNAIVSEPAEGVTVGITPNPAETCSGNNLQLFGNPTGGTPGYTHLWTGDGAASLDADDIENPTFNNTTGGNYELTYTVTDQNNCQATETINITNNQTPTADAGSDDVTCGNQYTLNATASVGTGTWTFSGPGNASFNDPNSTNATATVDTYGDYTFTWTEDNLTCTDSDEVMITFNENPSMTINIVQPSAAGSSDGEIEINVTDGNPPYIYTITDGGGTPDTFGPTNNVSHTFTNLEEDTYTIEITDANGCSDTQVRTLSATPVLTVNTSTSQTCGGDNGSLIIEIVSGSPNYTIEVTTVPGGSVIYSDVTPDVYFEWNDLAAGDYNIDITDNDTNNFNQTVTVDSGPTASITYEGSPFCGGGTADVTQTGESGGTYSAAPAGLSIDAATGQIDLDNSANGTYTVTYSFDDGTCFTSTDTEVVLGEVSTIAISYDDDPYCQTPGGTAPVTIDGQILGSSSATYTAGDIPTDPDFDRNQNFSSCPGTLTVSIPAGAVITAVDVEYDMSSLNSSLSYMEDQRSQLWCVSPGGTTEAEVYKGKGIDQGTYSYNRNDLTIANNVTGETDIEFQLHAGRTFPATGGCRTNRHRVDDGTWTVTVHYTSGHSFSAAPAGLEIDAVTGEVDLENSLPGTYTVTYDYIENGCAGQAETEITVLEQPTATISYDNDPYCQAGFADVTLTGTEGGTFSAPADLVIDAATGQVDLENSLTGTYTVTYDFANGPCTESTTTEITIEELPTATISYDSDTYCASGTTSVSITGQGGGTFSADPAGMDIDTATGEINLSNTLPDTYTVTYNFDNGNCSNSTSTEVTVTPAPTASISYDEDPYCAEGTATVTLVGQDGGTYSSTAGLSIDAATGDVDLAASTPGTYTVTYDFTDGVCNGSTTTEINVLALPTATISYDGDPYCNQGTAEVTITGTSGGAFTALPAGLAIDEFTGEVDLENSTTGTYTVSYRFDDGNCENITTTSITINEGPTATISYDASPYCAVGTADVTVTGQGGGTFSSTTGLSIDSATGQVDLDASTPGTYTITYDFSDGSCSGTTTTEIEILPLPTATISYDGSPYCGTGTADVTIDGQGGGTFSSGAGLTIDPATGQVDLDASTPGTYTVTYDFSDGTCSNSTTTQIEISTPPTATISYDGDPYCLEGFAEVTLTGQEGGTFSAPAGLIIDGASGQVDLEASTPGTYTVTYDFSEGTCTNSTTTEITINTAPTASISYDEDPYCASGVADVTITGQTGGTFSSTAGLSIDAGTGQVDLTTSTPGTYTVSYSFSDGNCSGNTTTTITVNALPTASITYDGSPFCNEGTGEVTITGTQGGAFSALPAGLVINEFTGEIDLAASDIGTYTVTYRFDDGTCENLTTTEVTINEAPVVNISYDLDPYCAEGTADVTIDGEIVSFSENTYTLGNIPTDLEFQELPGESSCPGTMTVNIPADVTITAVDVYYEMSAVNSPLSWKEDQRSQLRCVSPGGIDEPELYEGVGDEPGTQVYNRTGLDIANGVAGGGNILFDLHAGRLFGLSGCGTSRQRVDNNTWTVRVYYAEEHLFTAEPAGLDIDPVTGQIDLENSTPGTYTVTYSYSDGSCSSSTTATVTINPIPEATISYEDDPYCNTGSAIPTITGQTGGTFSAPADLTIDATTGEVDLEESTPGTFTVTYDFSDGTCSSSTTTDITINTTPDASISYDEDPYCASGIATVTLTGQGGGTFSAPAGLDIDAVSGDIDLETSTPGTYTVTYDFSDGSCSNSATTSITINALPTAAIDYEEDYYCAFGTAEVTLLDGPTGGTYSGPAGLVIDPATGEVDLEASDDGTFTVTYEFSENGCSNTTTTDITIRPLPEATISYDDSPYCADGFASPTITGQPGGTFSVLEPNLTINEFTGEIDLAATSPGTYTISYRFEDGFCENITTTTVTVNALPEATISYDLTPYCATGTAEVTLVGEAGGTFSAPTGLSIDLESGQVDLAASTPGTYTVTYSFDDGNCSNSATTDITINALPTASISYDGDPYCEDGGFAEVTLTGQDGGTFSADAGLSIDVTTGQVDLELSTPGTYTVTYDFSDGTCSSSTTADITINTTPDASISYDEDPYCATGIATATLTGQGGGTFSAPAGLIIDAVSGDVDLETSTPGTYTVTYDFSDGSCSNSATTSITINTLPTATIDYEEDYYCAFGTAEVTLLDGPTGGTYSGPAGLVIDATTGEVDLEASDVGTFTVTYEFSENGCSNTTTTDITIRPLPEATISYDGSPYCADGFASPTITGQLGGTFSSDPAGLTINEFTGEIDLAASTPGTYEVSYRFEDGFCENITFTNVIVNALPVATISYDLDPYCATGTADVTITGETGGTFSAPAGLSINATSGQVDLEASTPGTYTVTYSFDDGNCSSSTTTDITINALPTASISYNDEPYCEDGGFAEVTLTGQDGGTFSADAGLSIDTSTGEVDLEASTPGTYTVTYDFSDGTCSYSTTADITINALPTASISYDNDPYCATGIATATLTGLEGGTFSAPAELIIDETSGDIDLEASTPGTYTVTYEFSDGSCSNSATTSITINALPAATIDYEEDYYCAFGTAEVTLVDGPAGGTYSGPAGLVIDPATGEVDLEASDDGTFTVTYEFSENDCTNTTTTDITIRPLPEATISYDGSPYCADGFATPTIEGQLGGTFSSAPAGLTINEFTGEIDLANSTPGTYEVSYRFEDGFCENITTTTVTVNALPEATISYDLTPYCATGTADVTLVGETGGTFSAPAGLSINTNSGQVVLEASTPGTYTVTYSFDDENCSNSTTTDITINALPTASISYDGDPYCEDGGFAEVTLTGQDGGTFSADAGLSIDASTGQVDLELSTPGTYTVTYDFSDGTCSSSTTADITINTTPDASISYDEDPYCATGIATATLTGQGGGTFSAPAGLIIDAVSGDVDLETSTPGTYTVTYDFSDGSCSNSATTSITINALPTAAIDYEEDYYCAFGTAEVTLLDGPTGGTYSGPTGIVIDAATGEVDLEASDDGTFMVTYEFSENGCSNTTTTDITIRPLPEATISYDGSPYCADGFASPTITGQTGGTFSVLEPNLTINEFTGEIDLATTSPGTYTISYRFEDGFCENITTTTVTVNALPEATISYDLTPYCATGTAEVTLVGETGGTFSAPAGLSINTNSGQVDLEASTPGTYTVTYSFDDENCSNSTTTDITINALPTASISYDDEPYCEDGGFAEVTLTGQNGGTFSADAGLSIDATTGQVDLELSSPGTYTVTYDFSDGTCSSSTTAEITINALPTASISYDNDPYCATGIATVTLTGLEGGTFSAPAGLIIDETSGDIDLEASTPGTYNVTYDFSDGSCSNSATTSITINTLPTATIDYEEDYYCAFGTAEVTLVDGPAGGTYSGPAGLVIDPATGEVDLETSDDGTFTVTYEFSENDCTNTTTTDITIRPLPTASISYNDSPYCADGFATPTIEGQLGGTFSSAPAGLAINEFTGEIDLANSTSGTYEVSYRFEDGFCENITFTNVIVNALPQATISYDLDPYCATGTADVTITGETGGTFSAPAGLVIDGSSGQVDLETSTPGTYTVTYSFDDENCSNSTTTDITINALPTASISYDDEPYCEDGGFAEVTLTGQTGGNFSADAGLSIDASTGEVDLEASTPGNYTVTYDFSDGTCSSSTTAEITINALPTASISYDNDPYCASGIATVTLTGQGGGTFSAPAGLIIDETSGDIDLEASTPGTYTVTYEFSDGSCSNSATTSITINALPTATIDYEEDYYCAFGTAEVTLLDGPTGGTYSGPAGLVIDPATGEVDLETSDDGTFTVTYEFSENDCTNTTTTDITIRALPEAEISYPDSPYCQNSGLASPVIAGQQGGVFSGSGVVFENDDVFAGVVDLALTGPGTYTISYRFEDGFCENITTAEITIDESPTLSIISFDDATCTGEATGSITVQASGGQLPYTYNLLDTDLNLIASIVDDTGDEQTFTDLLSANYVVSVNDDNTCGSDVSDIIFIDEPDALVIDHDLSSIANATCNQSDNGSITISALGGTGTLTYTLEDADSGTPLLTQEGNGTFTELSPGNYLVSVTDEQNCGPVLSEIFNISEPEEIQIIATVEQPINCPGDTGSLEVTVSGGTPNYTVELLLDGNSVATQSDVLADTPVVFADLDQSGEYTIEVEDDNTCSSQTTVTIEDPAIVAVFDLTVTDSGEFCEGSAGVEIILSGSETGVNYELFLDGNLIDGSTTEGTGSEINFGFFDTEGDFTAQATHINNGCIVDMNNAITVTELPLPTATISYEADPYCALGSATVSLTGQAGGEFSAPAGVSINAATGEIDLEESTPGTYTVTYDFTDGNCSSSTTTDITINSLPTASINYDNDPYCASGIATITLTGQEGGTFSAPAGLIIDETSGDIDLEASTPGTYTVTYDFANANCSNTTTTSITINALPEATIDYEEDHYCAFGTAEVTLTGQGGGTFSAEDGVVFVDANTGEIDLEASTPGTYTVTYEFSDGICTNTATTDITIRPLPEATISYEDDPYCAVGVASPTIDGEQGGTFSSSPAGLDINIFTGEIDLENSTPGTYEVSYRFENEWCEDITFTEVTINAVPEATISYDLDPYCATGTAEVSISGQQDGTFTAPEELLIDEETGQVNLEASTPGTYTVTYSFEDENCSGSTTTDITINALPTASISYDGDPYCEDAGFAEVTLTGQPGGIYSAPDGLVIGELSGTVNLDLSEPGTYIITYEFDDGNCSNETSAEITINPLPEAVISYDNDPYCATGTANISISGQTGGTFTADPGLVIDAATGDVDLEASNEGTFLVTYEYFDDLSNCSNSSVTTITINALPEATISYDNDPYCATGIATVSLTGEAGGTFSADAGLVVDVNTGEIDLEASTPGTYTVTYDFSNLNCSNSTSTEITINPLPIADISYDNNPYCATGSAAVTLSGQTGGTFSSGAGLIIDTATGEVDLEASTPGIYTVVYDFNDANCSNSATAEITINALPIATIDYEEDYYCAFGTALVTLTGQIGGTFSAEEGVVFVDSNTGEVDLEASTPGTYTVTYNFTDGTCSNSTTAEIVIRALPVAEISYPDSPYCQNSGLASPVITGQQGGVFSGTGVVFENDDAFAGVVDLALTGPGTYTISYRFEDVFCENITTTELTITENPILTIISSDDAICAGEPSGSIAVQATGGQLPYTYNLFDTDNNLIASIVDDTGDEQTFSGLLSANYVVSVNDDNACGSDVSDIIFIDEPDALVIDHDLSSIANATCNQSDNGSITISALGGTGTLTYTLEDADSGTPLITQEGNGTFTELSPGNYLISVTDEQNCGPVLSEVFNISEPEEIQIIATVEQPINCPGDTGSLEVTVSGGTPDYVVELFLDGNSVATQSGVLADTPVVFADLDQSGEYTIEVEDANTCNSQTTITIEEPALVAVFDLTATDSGEFCEGSAGVEIILSGSETGVNYELFLDGNLIDGSTTEGTGSEINFGFFDTEGDYTAQATHINNGCIVAMNNTITLTELPLPVATISYDAGPYCEGAGIAEVTLTGQDGGTFSSEAGLVIDASTGEIDLDNSTAGTYTVVYDFTDGTCASTTSTEITITPIPEAPVADDLTVCFTGEEFTAGATSATGTTLTWYTDETGMDAGAPPTGTDPGTYTSWVSAVEDLSGCESERTLVTLTINDLPDEPQVNPTMICFDGSEYFAEAIAPAGSSVVYYTEQTDGSETTLPTATQPGTYTAWASSVDDATGCESDRVEVTLEILENPAEPQANNVSICFDGQTHIATASSPAGASIVWYTTETGDEVTTAPTGTDPGTYSAWAVSVDDNTACESERVEVTLVINELPEAPQPDNLTVCFDGTEHSADAIPPADSDIIWYSTEAGDEETTAPSGTDSGIYTAWAASVDTLTNCESAERTEVTLTILDTPVTPIAENTAVCFDGTEYSANATSSDGASIIWYASETGDETGEQPIATEPGTYTAWAAASFDGSDCESERVEVTLTIHEIPDMPTANNVLACFDGNTFTADATAPEGSNLVWYANETGSDAGAPPAGTDPGVYSAWASSVNDATGCESDRVEVTLTIVNLPDVPVADNLEVCYDGTEYTASATAPEGAVILWYADETTDEVAEAPTGTEPGTYSAWASSSIPASDCESDRVEVTLVINPIPDAFTGDDQTICYGDTIQLGPEAPVDNNTTYLWTSEPEGAYISDATIANPEVRPLENTTFTLTEISTETDCSNSNSVFVEVVGGETYAGEDQMICEGESVVIGPDESDPTHIYLWISSNPDEEFQNNVANPTVSPEFTTTYILFETTPGFDCESIDSLTVTVNPAPEAYAGEDLSICTGQSAQLGQEITDPLPPNTYHWFSEPEDESISDTTISNPVVSPLVTTTYTLIETYTLTGCSKENSVVVTVLDYPTADIIDDRVVCEGEEIQLSDITPDPALTYSWSSVPQGFSSDEANPSVIPGYYPLDENDQITFILEVSNGSCSTEYQTVITVNPLPEVDIADDMMFCSADDAVNTAIGGAEVSGYSYLWSSDQDPSFNSTESNPVVSPEITTMYTIEVTDNNGGCISTGSVTITIGDFSVEMAGNPVVCAGDSITQLGQFIALSGGSQPYQYFWTDNDGNSISSEINPEIEAPFAPSYNLLALDAMGCPLNITVVVEMLDLPETELYVNGALTDGSYSIFPGESVIFEVMPENYALYDFYVISDDESGTDNNEEEEEETGEGFKWMLADTEPVQSGESNTFTTTSLVRGDRVFAVVFDGNCNSATDTISILLNELPNAFTPNDDGINDVFGPGAELTIFNRWGQKVYEGRQGWDGTFNGAKVSPGTYYYLVTILDNNNQRTTVKGSVTVVLREESE